MAQVRVVFAVPQQVLSSLPPDIQAPKHLAYIEKFTPFPATPNGNHGMYTIKRCLNQEGDPLAFIIPVSDLHSSVHLYPQFGPVAPCEWTSSNVLDNCDTFYASPWSSRYAYFTIQ